MSDTHTPHERWEYPVMSPPLPEDFGRLSYGTVQRTMNLWGDEGWELVGTGFGALWFRRRLLDAPTAHPPAPGPQHTAQPAPAVLRASGTPGEGV